MGDSVNTLDNFSYTSPDDPWLKRKVVRAIERATGQPHLKRLYEDFRNNPVPDESFWDSAIRRLELKIICNDDVLARVPTTGPLVVVANHPFGVLDGVVISHLVHRVRKDFLVLTNEVLTRAEELRPFLLPIDFAQTPQALQTNLKSRAVAKAHLQAGGCLVVFPAGGVSTTPTPWHKQATDTEWKSFTGRLVSQARAPVVPFFFVGQNSRLFQLASHVSMTLRLSLLFKEVHDRIGSEVHVRVGETIAFDQLANINDRVAFMRHLRERTYELGAGIAPPQTPIKHQRRAHSAVPQ